MRAGFAVGKAADATNLTPARSRPTLMARMRDIWTIFSRAQAAAHYYEAHKPLSEEELAARGLTRADLPRSAFRKLTGTP